MWPSLSLYPSLYLFFSLSPFLLLSLFLSLSPSFPLSIYLPVSPSLPLPLSLSISPSLSLALLLSINFAVSLSGQIVLLIIEGFSRLLDSLDYKEAEFWRRTGPEAPFVLADGASKELGWDLG